MPYFTDTASSLTDLVTKVRTNLVTDLPVGQRYTQETDILHKGTLYVEFKVTTDSTDPDISTRDMITILGGTGSDGSGNLTGAPPQTGVQQRTRYAAMFPASTPRNFQFPVTYFLHVFENPDEVYLIVNDNTTRYTHLSFGQSPIDGLTATGNWYHATNSFDDTIKKSEASTAFGSTTTTSAGFPGLFFAANTSVGSTLNITQINNSFFNYGLDGNEWSNNGTGSGTPGSTSTSVTWTTTESCATCSDILAPLVRALPSSTSEQIVLIPPKIMVYRPSSASSIVGEVKHLFYTRIDNYDPQTVVNVGSDRYRLYPCIMKNSTTRDGGVRVNHSGTFGYAIRYDGP